MEKELHNPPFDFDHWSSVARDDPEQFEAMRTALLERTIAQCPESFRRRLQGLQWRIDQLRNQAANPMSACLGISKMMWNSLLGENGLLTALQQPEQIMRTAIHDDANKVVPLHKPENRR